MGRATPAPYGPRASPKQEWRTLLTVSEIFGSTFQGEGPSVGRRAGFLRLGRCNLACHWCDSAFTWDWDRYDPAIELTEMSHQEVLDRLDGMGVDMVVVTGGEPLLQQRQLVPVLQAMKDRRWRTEVETAGTIAPAVPDGLVDQWNVSPKLANSGNPEERRYKPQVLRAFQETGRAVFKFVVCAIEELDEVQEMVAACGLGSVWIMPEGTDAQTVTARLRELADPVLARGWSLTPRLHILLWGDERGR